jgi:ParB family chromosome partitioning protein
MLRLLNLPDFIQAALVENKISTGHARALITLEDEALQKKLVDKIIRLGWSVRQVEDAVRNLDSSSSTSKKKKPKKGNSSDPFYDEISRRLRRTFSTKVNIKQKAEGGEIKIEYYSEEDLERILAIFDSL